MKRLMYILLFLLVAANVAAQQSYVIDLVCAGTDRAYRIDTKEKGSTWEWYLKDTIGNEIAKPAEVNFWFESSPGDTTWGSEINIVWNDIGIFNLSTLHFSSHGCDTLEQGLVEVFEPPGDDAGIDLITCINEAITLSKDSAWKFSNLLWTTTGDGTFSDDKQLHPTYFPGKADSNAGSVKLILTAFSTINNTVCVPAIDSMQIRYSNPSVKFLSADLLCYNDSTGWAKVTAAGGIEPYSFSWTGPGFYTSFKDSIFGLAAGKYIVTVTDSIGCMVIDSVEIIEPLELLASISADIQQICDDDTIRLTGNPNGGTGKYTHLWTGSGAVYLNNPDSLSPYFEGALTGIYKLIYNVTDENGCTAWDTINLTVLPKDTIITDTVICGNEIPFAWLGKDYFKTNTYIDTLPALSGCDTIAILNLTVLPIDTIKLDTIICIKEAPFAWYGENYFATGNYIDTLTPLVGCDTILMLNLTVTPIDTITVDTIICGLEVPFALNGKDYFKTNVYTDTIPALIGCDTILILNLTVLPIDTIAVDTVICGLDAPFAWYGTNYYTTGVYTRTYNPPTGCDTILILDITVLPIDTLKFDKVICGMDVAYNWYGADYKKTGIYLDTLVSATGCDTILMLDLEVLPIDTITTDTIICISETPFAWYGNNYFTNGIYLDTLVSTVGCDSVLILDLTVLPVDTITFDTILCINETPFTWYGKDYNTTGIYTDTLAAIIGCDTILIFDLTVMPIDTIDFDTTICGTEAPFAWNGKDYFATGIYIDTLAASVGCDTIVILDLTVSPIDTLIVDTVICATETPFAWNGKDIFTTGIYNDTLASVTGCDTILILDLTVLPADTITFDTIICDTEAPFAWYGKNYLTTGIYKEILLSATGCDTVALLDLTVLPKITDYLDITICATAVPFTWYGQQYNLPGIYHDTLLNVYGCDTVLTLDLKILPEITVSLDTTICAGNAPFRWFGKDYFTTNIYNDTIFSKTGCDTLLELDLKVVPEILVTEKLTVCEGDLPYSWFGSVFNSADTVVLNIPSLTSGCDTLRILELQTIPEIYVTEKLTIYESELPYLWFKEIFNQADTIIQIVPSTTGGCDTIRTLELITIPGILITEKITICEDELPYIWFGKTFTQADTIVIIATSTTGGSDTIRTLELQAFPVKLVEISIVADKTAVCNGKLVIFTATTVNGGTSPLFTWYLNGKVVPGETSEIFTFKPNNGDEVYASVLSSLPCASGNPAKAIPVSIATSNNITPAIAGIGPFCQFSIAPPLPLKTLNGITGTWYPAKINTSSAVNNTFTFTPDTGQCALPVQIDIEVLPIVKPTFAPIGPLCQNSVAPLLPKFSTNGIKGTWNPATIETKADGTFSYTFTPDSGQCAVPVPMIIEVTPNITPVFIQLGPLCQNSAAPVLPTVSTNGIKGTWNPAIIATKKEGSFKYIFTPAAGQCAIPDTMTIEITPEITPVFLQIGPLCQNSIAPALPLVSANGITGTWSPAIINTAVIGKAKYTFKSDPGQCAVDTTVIIEITDKIKPVFAAIGPFCQNSIAPALPPVSVTGIKGIWSPDTILTANIGITPFKFTPDTGQCAVPVTINIEITDKIKPLFAAVGPLCRNSAAPVLPLVSTNGFKGTWSPAIIETKDEGSFTYLFTPDPGQCAVPVKLIIVITPETTPVFLQIGPLCQNSIAPALPLLSTNGITGTWSPAIIGTATIGTGNYTFTPNPNQCAVDTTISIEITDKIKPLFAAIGPFCQNSKAQALPLVSDNGIKGTWSPNTISTAVIGTMPYKFIPDADQCAVATTIDIEITDKIKPLFAALGPLCQNSVAPALPATSTNGVKGTWTPDTILTVVAGVAKFKFTPDPDQCATQGTLDVEILPEITPVFATMSPLCPNGVAPILPAVSTNGITGTWNPAIISTAKQGTFMFTFIPDSGQCAVKTTINIEISDKIPPVAICRPVTIYLDKDGKAKITTAQINNGSNDNCKLDTLFLSRYDFDCSDVGRKNPVTLTAVDAAGLSGFCVTTVTVMDTIKPVVVCKGPFEIQLDENAEYKLTVGEILVSASDACGIDTMYVNPHELDCDHIGLTTVRLWAVGVNRDSAYCETQVTIFGNRAPTIVDDSATTIENVPVIIEAVLNDFDEKNSIDISTLSILIKPQHGTVAINPLNGDFTYTPNRNFSGVDVLEYRICDNGIPCDPECGKAFVFITVEPVNDKPLAVDDYYDAGCFNVTRNVLDNDTDPDGTDYLQINTLPLTPPNHGTLIIDIDGTINYYPNEGFIGIDSFEYIIWDNGIPPLSDTAKVYISVDCNEENANPLDCELFVPEGFSPNEDGIHDFFRIMCIHNYPDAKLMIFNRNGNLLWQKEHYGNYDVWGDQYNAWWWGTSVLSPYDVGRQSINGDPKLKVGNYVYVLQLGDGEVRNGTVMISY